MDVEFDQRSRSTYILFFALVAGAVMTTAIAVVVRITLASGETLNLLEPGVARIVRIVGLFVSAAVVAGLSWLRQRAFVQGTLASSLPTPQETPVQFAWLRQLSILFWMLCDLPGIFGQALFITNGYTWDLVGFVGLSLALYALHRPGVLLADLMET